MDNITNAGQLSALLQATDRQLSLARSPFELVIIGGSGMLALRVGTRATHDVDLLATRSPSGLVRIDEMPFDLQAAATKVAVDFGLSADWLNPGPTALMDLGLPDGFELRLETVYEGDYLIVQAASRIDQIYFKLYALVDQGRSKHEQDLKALKPTDEELIRAAVWSRTHDPSDGYRTMLLQVLDHLAVRDASGRI